MGAVIQTLRKGGGGGAVSKKFFFRPCGPQFGLEIRGGGVGPLGPSPGSATAVSPCKGIRIPESVKFFLVESGILGLGIRNTAHVEPSSPLCKWLFDRQFENENSQSLKRAEKCVQAETVVPLSPKNENKKKLGCRVCQNYNGESHTLSYC